MNRLRRYLTGMDGSQLRRFLGGEAPPASEDTGYDADLVSIQRAVQVLTDDPADAIPSATDAFLAPVVHQALSSVPRRVLLDMRFWHWMTCEQFSDYVLRRWANDIDLEVDVSLTPAQQARFLGNASLAGNSRNALARLYWCAETLYTDEDQYELVELMLSSQDLFGGVFERNFGLVRPVARVCARELVGLPEDDRRLALRRLNLEASTLSLEALDEAAIRSLLGV